MDRIPPILNVEELWARHEPFIQDHTNYQAVAGYLSRLPSLVNPDPEQRVPAIWADDLLRRKSLAELDGLEFRKGRCTSADQHPVAGPLIRFMIDASCYGISEHPLYQPRWTAKQLSEEADDPSLNVRTPLHCDHGDGHAQTFHWRVRGALQHLITPKDFIEIKTNRIITLSGQYERIPALGYYGTVSHWASPMTDLSRRRRPRPATRNRLLAYVDGEDTGYQGDYFPPAYRQMPTLKFEVVPSLPSRLLAKLIH